MAKAIRKSLPRQIAELIEEKIARGEYQIGDRLPPEPMLTEYFGVSRNTVREAIQSLTNSGLLATRQGDGTYVIARERLQVDFFRIMDSSEQHNVLEVRDLLEKHIAVSAIRNATDSDLERIAQKLELRRQVTGSIREAGQADLAFHMAIAEATHNDIILSIYRYVSEYFNEFIYEKLYAATADQASIDRLHDGLLRAIRDKDPDGALDCVNRIIAL